MKLKLGWLLVKIVFPFIKFEKWRLTREIKKLNRQSAKAEISLIDVNETIEKYNFIKENVKRL